MDSYDLDQVFDVDFGGDMTTQYDYEGIQVYPKAMVYNGVAYTLQENVTTLEGSGTATVPYLIKTTYDLDLVVFFFSGRKIIVTNGFVKKSQETPPSEIEMAKKYRTDYLDRS